MISDIAYYIDISRPIPWTYFLVPKYKTVCICILSISLIACKANHIFTIKSFTFKTIKQKT